MSKVKFAIIGAGPTGLGAARRLQELGENNFFVFEAEKHIGGLSSSFVDAKGFTWDIGGHVQFSHYDYFDKTMVSLLPWLEHQRESWVWIKERFVPYPFQNNLRYLPKESMWKCLSGIIEVYKNQTSSSNSYKPKNFKEWIYATFGPGIAEEFMMPYNYKVWAYPPEDMNYVWIGERVAVTDLARATKNILFELDDLSWGPNNTFKFPEQGGTGAIWQSLAKVIGSDHFKMGQKLVSVDPKGKVLKFADGSSVHYEHLLSTIPLNELTKIVVGLDSSIVNESQKLLYSNSNVIGIGLKGKPTLGKKCWMYFPESNSPFYRATVFSNYSPKNVPNIQEHWSLMAEVSESQKKPVNQQTLVEDTIQGFLANKMIPSRLDIISTWTYRAKYGYPIPSVERDNILKKVTPSLDSLKVFSRGRFGAWKYEVSNQDHSFMQGVEWVNSICLDVPETTLRFASTANAMWGRAGE